ncbi:CHRD domain-containing protein [Nonomuraea sp. NPDC003709]|uniref:CHRD domain-containing protein n=1 Tax=Nonomuraea sp. NPDC003709 TaxID=3154450 RepID=UPI0033A30D17
MNIFERPNNGRISWRRVVGGASAAGVVAAAALSTMAVVPAAAAPWRASDHPAGSVTVPAAASHAMTTSGRKYYFTAELSGRNEVREPGKKVNDPNGVAVARFRIEGTRLYYAVRFAKTGRPTAFHIHRGKAGVNGPVVINLLSNGDIRGNIASGSVRVKSSLLRDIKAKPKNWYANLHTGEFPDGAVRGQLHSANHW